MFKVISLTVCLLLLSLAIAAGLQAEDITCRNYSSDGYVRSLGFQQIIDFNRLKNVQVSCLDDYSGNYPTQHVNGFTLAEFESDNIEVFVRKELSGELFALTLIHELTHVEQYLNWMNSVQMKDPMAKNINIIHTLVEPQGINTSFQTKAKMKRYSGFNTNTKSWFNAYLDMHFCMEYQAYNNESRYAKQNDIVLELLPEYLQALRSDEIQPLLELLNSTLIKRLNDSEYSGKELKRAYSVCGAANEPVGWFRASAKALNLVE